MTTPAVPFVRTLFPPSSPDKSEAGIDVLAVKRAVSRAGFWPWQEFDETYSQAFAVKGVGGFQKSVGLPVDHVYGQNTHAKLRIAKAVDHPGEYAFDATAVSLMKQAKAQQQPKEQKVAETLERFCATFDGPYVYGGEHDRTLTDDSVHNGFDCSSSVSFALFHVGLLGDDQAHVSGWFKSWGEPGRGRFVTVHAASDHVWIEFTITGHQWARFDTSPHGCGEHGPRLRPCARDSARFVSRHPRGF
jgi:cell wall-associated NlpC family hydrolase